MRNSRKYSANDDATCYPGERIALGGPSPLVLALALALALALGHILMIKRGCGS
ncbi:hypothetical protein DFO67_11710 [Modicisalibacter xianhensis]|uniref:Uncharacterized protein n=1 Tax=Modicisalibacter xianhensis TaxID=442341 RepID=A0A4R8FPQ9_9GAMM|nr:hypothetical protein DFO67_11710 [Halomonas xianhensis]